MDRYCRDHPAVVEEARSRFMPQADLGAVVRYADYLLMPEADRAVCDFWRDWVEYLR